MFTYNNHTFEANSKHKYNFIPNKEGNYEFTNSKDEKIILPLWSLEILDLSPSITDLSKYDKAICDYFRLNFGDKILAEALNSFKKKDLFTQEYFPYESSFDYTISQAVALYLPYLVTYPIKEFKGDGWERYVDKLCISVFVKNKYDLWTGKLLKKCLELKYPWLKFFKISEYSIGYGNFDEHLVFLSISNGENIKSKNIYIPLKAFIDRDTEAIKKYHTDYFTNYYKWPGGWGKNITKEDVLGWRKENLDLLESDAFKEFCEYLEGKEVESNSKTKKFFVTMAVEGIYRIEVECDAECGLEEIKEAATKAWEEADFGELEDLDIEGFIRYSSDEGEYEF